MAFIRIKRISGKDYAYFVASSWTAKGPRQNVAKYLGRVVRPEKAKSEDLKAFLGLTSEQEFKAWIGKSSFNEIALALIRLELGNHNVSSSEGEKGLKINAENAEFTDGKGRPVVFALNDGFLCGDTAKKLLGYDPTADYSGYFLADALTAAGIAVEKDVFISLFGKAQAVVKKLQETAEDKAFRDFYY